MLAVIGALGSWPATFLPRRFDGVARVAMAPVLGLCAGTCVFTTLVWFVPASDTYWLVPLLCACSLAGAVYRVVGRDPSANGMRAARTEIVEVTEATGCPGRRKRRLIGLLQILIVCVAVAGPITYAFGVRQSVGPVGYRVGDAQGYVAEIDGLQHQSIRQAVRAAGTEREWSNLALNFLAVYANSVQELDATPLSANVDQLVGLWGTDTQSPFLVAFLISGALGLYAAMRWATRRGSWVAVLAAALFGGAFFLQLFFDGSEGAITGLAAIIPLAVLLTEALRMPRLGTLVLLALCTSGLVALYPLFLPAVVLGAMATCVVLGVCRLRVGGVSLRMVGLTVLRVGLLASLAGDVQPLALVRAARYWDGVLHGALLNRPLPKYTFLTAASSRVGCTSHASSTTCRSRGER